MTSQVKEKNKINNHTFYNGRNFQFLTVYLSLTASK